MPGRDVPPKLSARLSLPSMKLAAAADRRPYSCEIAPGIWTVVEAPSSRKSPGPPRSAIGASQAKHLNAELPGMSAAMPGGFAAAAANTESMALIFPASRESFFSSSFFVTSFFLSAFSFSRSCFCLSLRRTENNAWLKAALLNAEDTEPKQWKCDHTGPLAPAALRAPVPGAALPPLRWPSPQLPHLVLRTQQPVLVPVLGSPLAP